ncbi:hypothetical protein I7I51_08959 [Histoplasma capsulatum]|uniref:Uncharacterized protein n=1 Tax=Ajellomyces capsulatus TaxID=5037 RepID=A0A8A1M4E3_AJECA|nr:hypothetical protein I7I51_08959 [Histoplasma capsulatum]
MAATTVISRVRFILSVPAFQGLHYQPCKKTILMNILLHHPPVSKQDIDGQPLSLPASLGFRFLATTTHPLKLCHEIASKIDGMELTSRPPEMPRSGNCTCAIERRKVTSSHPTRGYFERRLGTFLLACWWLEVRSITSPHEENIKHEMYTADVIPRTTNSLDLRPLSPLDLGTTQ